MLTIPQEALLYIILALAAVCLGFIFWIARLEKRIRTLTRGRTGENLEQVIKSFERDIQTLATFRGHTEQYLTTVERRLRRSIQGLSHVSFNAFQGLDSGGRQSFAAAFMDEHGNGIILSTLHARDRVNVFAKEVKQWNPTLQLTEEEADALTRAKESCKL
ncbi:MAG: hypothetical protein RL150_36 [Candidatus Parcubacteria bacterium]|jgi:hypothetical protein